MLQQALVDSAIPPIMSFRGTRWPLERTVEGLPLGSEFSGITAYGAGIPCRPTLYLLTVAHGEPGRLAVQSSAFFAAVIIAAGGASCGVEAWAADVVSTGATAATAASAPKPCTDGWGFIAPDCQLTWKGITVYGTIDAGFGWQSHGAPWDPRSAVGASYSIHKKNNPTRWRA